MNNNNSIALAQKYQGLLDEVFQAETKTADLESETVKFDNSKTVNILKLELPALADYSRNSGFTSGDVTATWEAWTLAEDKGREFCIDAMDNEETLDVTFGKASSEFIRTKVVPQVDMYRFAKLASTSGISSVQADPATDAAWESAISVAEATLGNDEVPEDGRILYITYAGYEALKRLFATRFASKVDQLDRNFETFDGMKVVKVPQSRFVSAVTKDSVGTYSKASNGYNINFMIVHPSAVEAVAKHRKLRVFTPDENQDADAYKFQYRLYHDIFAYVNKVAGIYVHEATT